MGKGFCVLNDVAIAIRVLQREGRITRAAVVDLDVHQGNGTARIFADDPDVFTFSMHGARNYPVPKGAEPDSTWSSTTGAGTRPTSPRWRRTSVPVLEAARPELVFYLGGADPFAGDRFGRLGLSVSGLERARPAGVPGPPPPGRSGRGDPGRRLRAGPGGRRHHSGEHRAGRLDRLCLTRGPRARR